MGLPGRLFVPYSSSGSPYRGLDANTFVLYPFVPVPIGSLASAGLMRSTVLGTPVVGY